MAYSGTVSQTKFNILLSDLSNRGIQLWCIEKQIYPLYDGVPTLPLDVGTLDILNSNLRTLQQVTGINTDNSTSRTVFFPTPTFVTTVGVKWSAAAAPIALERSDDGVAWTTVQTETPTASAGEWTWFDLESSVATPYFRVLATSGTLDFSRIYLGNTPTEIPIARLSRDDYTNLPNKSFQSNRPLQFWLDRQVVQPVMYLWPVPSSSAEDYQIVIWRQRYIMDVGSMAQEIEVPQRWYDAIVSMLAAKLAMEYIEVDAQMIPMLDQKAKEALYFAQQEERDNSPMMILPNFSMYTA